MKFGIAFRVRVNYISINIAEASVDLEQLVLVATIITDQDALKRETDEFTLFYTNRIQQYQGYLYD